MKSFLKTALPIGLAGAFIFAITFMSQFTTPSKTQKSAVANNPLPPLIAGVTERRFDPTSEEAIHRNFNGFFEVGTPAERNRVGFIVRNPRQTPVRLSALIPSCTACTSARGAAIPPTVLDEYVTHVAATTLWGPQPFPDLASAVAWQALYSKLNWHGFEFGNPANKFELPGAPTTGVDAEQWGLLELSFHMSGPTSLQEKKAWFTLSDTKDQPLQPMPFEFKVMCAGREAFDMQTGDYQIGELSASIPSQSGEMYCLSATRDILPPPVVSVGNQDPFVKLGAAVPLTTPELLAISKDPRTLKHGPVLFRSGYRVPFTVHREANGKLMDLGQFEKEIFVAGGEGVVLTKSYRIKVVGAVIGFLRLEKGNNIEFGSYDANFTVKKDVRLWTELKDVDLEVVPELCQPNFLKVSLSKPSLEADRTYWTLNLQIPEKEGRRPPWDGAIVLRTKGKDPVVVRVQVTGHGR